MNPNLLSLGTKQGGPEQPDAKQPDAALLRKKRLDYYCAREAKPNVQERLGGTNAICATGAGSVNPPGGNGDYSAAVIKSSASGANSIGASSTTMGCEGPRNSLAAKPNVQERLVATNAICETGSVNPAGGTGSGKDLQTWMTSSVRDKPDTAREGCEGGVRVWSYNAYQKHY